MDKENSNFEKTVESIRKSFGNKCAPLMYPVGKEADFVVLDTDAAHITARRAAAAETLDELLFALIFLGDDRNVAATYLLGDRYAG